MSIPIHERFRQAKWSSRERRLLFLINQTEAQEILENGGSRRTLTTENMARELHDAMHKRLTNIGFFDAIKSFGKGRAREKAAEKFLDAAAIQEIQNKTDLAYGWIGHLAHTKKYREYVSLKNAVKERMREELETYVRARIERVDRLSYAARVSAKLKNLDSFVSLQTTDDVMANALAAVQKKLQKVRAKAEQKGMGISDEWKEGAQKESALKQQLIRFGVVSVPRLELLLQSNADGNNDLIDAIQSASFIDPEDPDPRAPHIEERQLCLRIAKQLKGGMLLRDAYQGYRNFRLTQRTGNELPIGKRLQTLAEDPIGRRVQLLVSGSGKVDAFVVARDGDYPEALILQGPGSRRFVLITNQNKLGYMEGSDFRFVTLTDSTFSILQN